MAKSKLTAANLAGSNSSRGREENDYYATPPIATEAILNEINLLNDSILEPAAGEGHIVKVLKERYPYNEIIANDLVERESRFGIDVNGNIDFLSYEPRRKFGTIITNPPFKYAQQFIEKSLTLAEHYVIMFAKIQFLETVERKKMFEEHPPKFVFVFSRRVSPWRNGNETDENGKAWASPMCFAWYVWEIGYEGETIVRWL